MSDSQDNLPVEAPERLPDGRFLPGHNIRNVPKLSDPIEVEAAINHYFDACDTRQIDKTQAFKDGPVTYSIPEPYTLSGLAFALGITRQTLRNYNQGLNNKGESNQKRIFSMITRARAFIEKENIALGLVGVHDAKIATLNLSSNFDYTTKTESTNFNINRDMSDDELDGKIMDHLSGVIDV